jgi:hypothetical protein
VQKAVWQLALLINTRTLFRVTALRPTQGVNMKKYQKPVVVKLGSVLLIKGNKNLKSDFTTVGFL